MPERVKAADRTVSPERLQYQHGLVGLQVRLLIGGQALNPRKLDLPPVTQQSLCSFELRDYSPFATASTRERKNHWQGKEGNEFAKQKTAWVNRLVNLFEQNKSYFATDREGKQWSNLYKRLGIDTQAFSREQAEALYAKYFGGRSASDIKRFVADVVAQYRGQSDLDAIQWLAHIFGNVSSEVIAQLIDAEIQLQTKPQDLITRANAQEHDLLRVNNLLPKEKELLAFLWGGEKVEWKYIRPEEPRMFPDTFSFLEQAKALKQYKPGKYDGVEDETLAQEMEQESRELQRVLDDYGLSKEELHNMTIGFIEKEVLNHYRQFVQSHYAVTFPSTERINVLPIWGKMSELHNPSGRALAFVNGIMPYIFLDMNVIAAAAKNLTNRDWHAFSRDERGELIKRLIREIKPHEYTHLMSDLTYWSLVTAESGKPDETVLSHIGKLGLLVAKKPKNVGGQLVSSERGRGLMEAVTVELTRQWSRSMGAHLDIPAYAAQRQVLYTLRDKLHRDEKLPQHEVFKKFVQGYFDRKGFYDLVKFVNHGRPHYLSIIYALMDYEERKAAGHRASPFYSMTVHYINGGLDQFEKRELLANLDRLKLPPRIREHLQRQLE